MSAGPWWFSHPQSWKPSHVSSDKIDVAVQVELSLMFIPIRSITLVYLFLATWMVDLYGNCTSPRILWDMQIPQVILPMFMSPFFFCFAMFTSRAVEATLFFLRFRGGGGGMIYSKPLWIQRAYRPEGSRSEKSIKLADLTMEHGLSKCRRFPPYCPRA